MFIFQPKELLLLFLKVWRFTNTHVLPSEIQTTL